MSDYYNHIEFTKEDIEKGLLDDFIGFLNKYVQMSSKDKDTTRKVYYVVSKDLETDNIVVEFLYSLSKDTSWVTADLDSVALSDLDNNLLKDQDTIESTQQEDETEENDRYPFATEEEWEDFVDDLFDRLQNVWEHHKED